MMRKFQSNALWPDGICSSEYGDNISTDTHPSRIHAQVICDALTEGGFGGMHQVFPITTWVSEVQQPPKVPYKILEQQLTAEREAREKAEQRIKDDFEVFHDTRMRVSEACGDPYLMHDDAVDLIIQRMKSAEQKLRDAQEQEPVAWMHPNGGVLQKLVTGLERETYTIPLYAAPIPPEDIAEFQRQVGFWKNSSEEWKLAYVALGGTASESGKVELTKLLEESKRQAVPEGWKLVPIVATDEMKQAAEDCLTTAIDSGDIYKAMLSAIPEPLATPEERIKEGRI